AGGAAAGGVPSGETGTRRKVRTATDEPCVRLVGPVTIETLLGSSRSCSSIWAGFAQVVLTGVTTPSTSTVTGKDRNTSTVVPSDTSAVRGGRTRSSALTFTWLARSAPATFVAAVRALTRSLPSTRIVTWDGRR